MDEKRSLVLNGVATCTVFVLKRVKRLMASVAHLYQTSLRY